jgi:hypothetical protein
MDLDFAVLADGVTQRPDGKLDIYGAGFDTVHAPNVPALHPRLVLAIRLLLSRHEMEHEHRLDVILSGADGDELARAHGGLTALDEEQRTNIPPGRQAGIQLILNFDNVIFPEFGAYQLAVHWDGNEARPPLRLFVAPPLST